MPYIIVIQSELRRQTTVDRGGSYKTLVENIKHGTVLPAKGAQLSRTAVGFAGWVDRGQEVNEGRAGESQDYNQHH